MTPLQINHVIWSMAKLKYKDQPKIDALVEHVMKMCNFVLTNVIGENSDYTREQLLEVVSPHMVSTIHHSLIELKVPAGHKVYE